MAMVDSIPVVMPVMPSRARAFWPAVRRVGIVDRIAIGGAIGITVLAIITPLIAPYDPVKPAGATYQAPGQGFLLGPTRSAATCSAGSSGACARRGSRR